VRDGVVVAVGGQVERVLGLATAFALRWGLDPARLGVFSGLRMVLDNTNRTSLGVSLGAVQEIPRLEARGETAEADRVACVAYGVNTLTCLVYALGLVMWAAWRAPALAGTALAAEWTWGLVAMAGLCLLKRYETFLIAVLRARREFVLTARVDVLESLVSAVAVVGGLAVAGFWGLLGGVGVILGAKIAYLHAQHPWRFRWVWDGRLAWRLMRLGMPILANTAAFGCVLGWDRFVVLSLADDGERLAGLYSVAWMGTAWSLDLAGRITLVLQPYYRAELGRTEDPKRVALRAAQAAEVIAPVLIGLSAVAYVVGPPILGGLLPGYREGLAALRPLMPGMVLLALAWPARQLLIAVERPWRLLAATGAGLVVLGPGVVAGLKWGGLVGVAWGVTAGAFVLYVAVAVAAFGSGWLEHLGRVARAAGWPVVVALLTAHADWPGSGGVWGEVVRGLVVTGGVAATLWRTTSATWATIRER
jgi:O-antigen/teichoic acid export membrane protein